MQRLNKPNHQQRGFSLLELVVVTAVVLVLAASMYIRYMGIVADAERAAFKGVLSWLQAGINMETSRALTRGDLVSLKQLDETNPMALVAKVMATPSNYLGELNPEQARKAAPGHWYYDLDQRYLVYHVDYTENLDGMGDLPDNRLNFKLKLVTPSADSSVRRSVRRIRLEPELTGFWNTPLSFGKVQKSAPRNNR